MSELIEYNLELFGFDLPSDFVRSAKEKGHFAFFFDGFDEVEHAQRKKLIDDITRIVTKYPDCPVFVSSRPEDTLNGIDEFLVFDIASLSLEKAISLVEKLPFDEAIKQNFVEDLADGLFEMHEDFLSNPLLLSIMLLTYGENAEIPTKISVFYNQAYEALFQRHDAQKGGYSRKRLTNLDIQDFARVFSLFSLQTYEKRKFKMAKSDCLEYIRKSRDYLGFEFAENDYLTDLLNAACLLIEDGLEISYSHRSFQEYFVAKQVLYSDPNTQQALIDRYWKNVTTDSVIFLLFEMNPDLIERLLLVPAGEKLFEMIGVKKRVGVSHAMKFLKIHYNKIVVTQSNISAFSLGVTKPYARILQLLLRSANYRWPKREGDDLKLHEDLIRCYSHLQSNNGEIEIDLKKASYKTPVLREILDANGFFSTEALEFGFQSLKNLKTKHRKQTKNLEDLLGI